MKSKIDVQFEKRVRTYATLLDTLMEHRLNQLLKHAQKPLKRARCGVR